MMEWISVDKELPPNEELVDVLANCSCDYWDVLAQVWKPWIFRGLFHRARGWKLYFANNAYEVTHWRRISDPKGNDQ